MKKAYMLKKNKEFRYVYHRGSSYTSSTLVLICVKNKLGPRFGFSVNKKLGHAVQRNRIKRLMREAASFYLPQVKQNQSYLFIARTNIAKADFNAIKRDMEYLLKKSGMLGDSV